jgi:hypothetical protein
MTSDRKSKCVLYDGGRRSSSSPSSSGVAAALLLLLLLLLLSSEESCAMAKSIEARRLYVVDDDHAGRKRSRSLLPRRVTRPPARVPDLWRDLPIEIRRALAVVMRTIAAARCG